MPDARMEPFIGTCPYCTHDQEKPWKTSWVCDECGTYSEPDAWGYGE